MLCAQWLVGWIDLHIHSGGDRQHGLKKLLHVEGLLWVADLKHDLHSSCADDLKEHWRLQYLYWALQ